MLQVEFVIVVGPEAHEGLLHLLRVVDALLDVLEPVHVVTEALVLRVERFFRQDRDVACGRRDQPISHTRGQLLALDGDAGHEVPLAAAVAGRRAPDLCAVIPLDILTPDDALLPLLDQVRVLRIGGLADQDKAGGEVLHRHCPLHLALRPAVVHLVQDFPSVSNSAVVAVHELRVDPACQRSFVARVLIGAPLDGPKLVAKVGVAEEAHVAPRQRPDDQPVAARPVLGRLVDRRALHELGGVARLCLLLRLVIDELRALRELERVKIVAVVVQLAFAHDVPCSTRGGAFELLLRLDEIYATHRHARILRRS